MQRWNELTEYRGFLFIGDPHVSSVAPGRRIDDYLTTVLGKLSVAAKICHEQRLVPVILGDLIHRDKESSIALVNRLSRVLREFPCTPIELDGNHGKQQFRSTEGDVEHLLDAWGFLQLAREPGLVGSFVFDGMAVNLFAWPHGEALPSALPAGSTDSVNVLITHHDLAFEGAYPGAKPVTSIGNCHMLVNGHMHKTTPSLTVGEMRAHNPGNIEPLSLDVADHEPAVWEWCPEQLDFELVKHLLPHDARCFDLTGVQVAPAEDAEAAVEAALKESQFAKLLAGEATLDAHRTSDGTVLLEDLDAVCDTANASPAVRSLLTSLIRKATEGAEDARS
jgi:hypothetical protein